MQATMLVEFVPGKQEEVTFRWPRYAVAPTKPFGYTGLFQHAGCTVAMRVVVDADGYLWATDGHSETVIQYQNRRQSRTLVFMLRQQGIDIDGYVESKGA